MDVLMPQLGETVAEGKILAWFKSVGDEVREGDNIFEVETDKVTMEVQATVAGLLNEIRTKAGDVVKVGTVVAVIGGPGDNATVPVKSEIAKVPRSAISPFEEVQTSPGHFGSAKETSGVRITPLARRLIAQNGLDTDHIAREVTGRGGTKIEKRDVVAALAGSQTEDNAERDIARLLTDRASKPSGGTVVEFNNLRRRTAERLAENWRTIPHVFQAIEVDFTRVETIRSKQKESFRAAFGVSLTYLPFIARAVSLALREFPQINARLDGHSLVLEREINLGIAVDLSHEGLVVPVIRSAGELTVPGLARTIGRAVDSARARKLTSDDLTGGTYSITNNGAFGTTFTSPIINAPQVAILSVDAIRKRPAIVETPEGEFIAPRLMGMIGQSFDHRAFDGAYSASFLSRLKAIIEQRDWSVEFQ